MAATEAKVVKNRPGDHTVRPADVEVNSPLALAGAAAILAAGVSAAVPPTPLLVWNATPSAPVGLYAVTHAGFARDDLVLVRTPLSVRSLAAARHYLPANVPLVKRITAIAGDKICALGEHIFVDGAYLATRLRADSAGRPLPRWQGCHQLADGEIFLLMKDVPDSFDGRYFGPVFVSSVIGELVPIWTR